MGATDNEDLGGAASALVVPPPFETQYDYLARTKVPRQWGFMGAATSSAVAAPLFDTEEMAKNGGRSLFLSTQQTSGGLGVISLQTLKLFFVYRERF